MKIFKLPDLGEGLQEAEIVAWHVAEGDEIKADASMVSVETAKAVVDVPAPYTGKIERLFGKPGDIVNLGAPLVGFEGEETDGSTSVVGRIEPPAPDDPVRAQVPRPGHASVRATPAVRALARSLDVDLALLTGTGPGGAVMSADVEQAAARFQRPADFERLRGARRTMASAMQHAAAEVAAVTLFEDADIDAWPDTHGVLIRLVRALIVGVRREPCLNAWFDRTAGRRILETVDLGVAVDAPEGLFVPVLRNADALAPDALEFALKAIIRSARERNISPEKLHGATFTVSNFGSISGRYATPLVLPPTVAILGAGRVRDEVVVIERQPAVRRILPLSLTFDHRCVTGGEAARFIAAVISDLELAQ